MKGNKRPGKPKRAVVIVSSEIALRALGGAVEALGYEVRQDIESCGGAEFGIVDAYFAFFGIVPQIRLANPGLPLIVVISKGNDLGAPCEPYFKDIFDVIQLDGCDEVHVREKFLDWFLNGMGQFIKRSDSHEKSNRK